MDMTKEESIALAEKLSKKYKEYESVRQEIDDNKHELSRPVNLEHKPHAAFKFFWPFLIASAASILFFYFLVLIAGSVPLMIIFSIPIASRNSAGMEKVLKLLQTDKAGNFSEALEML